jgi:hypothetical protein
MLPTVPGTVIVAARVPVRGSNREIVPVVGAATQREPSPTAVTAGSGKSRPRSLTVRTTASVVGSTCETVLSTSFVTQSEPAARATPEACLPTWTVEPTTSAADGAPPDIPAAARSRIVAAVAVMGSDRAEGAQPWRNRA